MNTLLWFKTLILSNLSFCVFYPLCFWFSSKKRMPGRLHKKHLFLINVMSGILLVILLFMNISLWAKGLAILWKGVLLYASRRSWRKSYPNKVHMTVVVLIGLLLLAALFHEYSFATGIHYLFPGLILSALVLCDAVFRLINLRKIKTLNIR